MVEIPMEVPYNFDPRWLDFLKLINPDGRLYDCIYLPPFYQDYMSAKYNYNSLCELHNLTREEYVQHLNLIESMFPGKICLLLQKNDMLMDQTLLEQFYMPLGIKKFCVGSIEQAKVIKEFSPSFEVMASITMKLTPEQLNNDKDIEKYFDKVVLFFPYNRDIDTVAKLPTKFKYILLVNCICNVDCPGTHHWFASKQYEDETVPKVCPNINGTSTFKTQMFIRPTDLPLWADKIYSIKLQGREFNTPMLIYDFMAYLLDYEYYHIDVDLDKNLDLYKATTPLSFFNTKDKEGQS